MAASSKEIDRYNNFIGGLNPNWVITEYWPDMFKRGENNGWYSDEELPGPVRAAVFNSCREGVKSASVFVFLSPTLPTRGAWAELGIASMCSGMMYASGHPGTAFSEAFHKIFNSDSELLGFLNSWGNFLE